jgi:hypothetical protein
MQDRVANFFVAVQRHEVIRQLDVLRLDHFARSTISASADLSTSELTFAAAPLESPAVIENTVLLHQGECESFCLPVSHY